MSILRGIITLAFVDSLFGLIYPERSGGMISLLPCLLVMASLLYSSPCQEILWSALTHTKHLDELKQEGVIRTPRGQNGQKVGFVIQSITTCLWEISW